jgi:hypothetical protein
VKARDTDGLAGIRAKLDRVDEHLEVLRGISVEVLTNFQHRTDRSFDPVARAFVFRVRLDAGGCPPIPLKFAVVAGEIANQLRSALDHLVCALYLKQTAVPNPRILRKLCFPIAGREQDQSGIRRQQGFLEQQLGREFAAEVDRWQPHNCPNGSDHSALRILQEINNLDKHRSLIFMIAAAERQSIGLGDGRMSLAEFTAVFSGDLIRAHKGSVKLADGVEIGRIPSDRSDAGVQLGWEPTIVFETVPLSALKPVLRRLQWLRDEVRTIIEEFESRFWP